MSSADVSHEIAAAPDVVWFIVVSMDGWVETIEDGRPFMGATYKALAKDLADIGAAAESAD
jgi:hypothetical protein